MFPKLHVQVEHFGNFPINENTPVNNPLRIINCSLKNEIKSTYHHKLTQLENLREFIAHAKKKN